MSMSKVINQLSDLETLVTQRMREHKTMLEALRTISEMDAYCLQICGSPKNCGCIGCIARRAIKGVE